MIDTAPDNTTTLDTTTYNTTATTYTPQRNTEHRHVCVFVTPVSLPTPPFSSLASSFFKEEDDGRFITPAAAGFLRTLGGRSCESRTQDPTTLQLVEVGVRRLGFFNLRPLNCTRQKRHCCQHNRSNKHNSKSKANKAISSHLVCSIHKSKMQNSYTKDNQMQSANACWLPPTYQAFHHTH